MTTLPEQPAPRPRFSIVSPVYDVARYLPEFIDSIEAQRFDLSRVQLIMVDDGSTDGCAEILAAWQRHRPEVVVIRQDNAGQASARNAGMALATGEWITFPDPDDFLEEDYLAAVDRFLTEHLDTQMVGTRRMMWQDGAVTDTHALRPMFRRDLWLRLDQHADYFHGSSATSFFRLDEIRRMELEFDPRVRPKFEDGHFNVSYLLGFDAPAVGFLRSPVYRYRRRYEGDSTTDRARLDPALYGDLLEFGMVDLVSRARDRFGSVPGWLQHNLIHDLRYYFYLVDSRAGSGIPLSGPAADRYHQLLGQVLGAIEPERIEDTWLQLNHFQRYAMVHGYRDEPWHEPFVLVDHHDNAQRLVQAKYFFTGEQPREEIRGDGAPIRPIHAKTRRFTYLGRTLMRQRTLWLPDNVALEIDLDGSSVGMLTSRPQVPLRHLVPGRIRSALDRELEKKRARRLLEGPVPISRIGLKARRMMDKPSVVARYRDAWVFVDRVHDANDNAEILFRWVRRNRPKVNAWFVLEKDTAEWDRFVREGDKDRLVAYDSLEWRLLMANASQLISSHADVPITDPPAIREFTRPQWRYHFIEHGVIKDDLSGWLNTKRMDTFVTSTPQEHASIAGDDTPYKFSSRETKMTGLPRFDRLLQIGREYPPERRDLILVTPTWRKTLVADLEAGSQRRHLDSTALESDFVQQWLAFLTDPALERAAAEHGVQIGFLPHPNFQALLGMMDLPEHIAPLTYVGNDVQRIFARARVLVTDFSSIAFNAAYLERPVVYFQFDEEDVLGGGHTGRQDYFEYRRDGFGPVETTHAGAIAGVVDALANGPGPAPVYQARIDRTFPERDGRCCERLFEAIKQANQSHLKHGPVPTPTPPPRDDAEQSTGTSLLA